MTSDTLLADDFRADPYWWDAAPRPATEPPPLPNRVDVAIVGSGITGLVAALDLARSGRNVAVFDSGDPGIGASSRNAGFLGRVLKHDFGTLADHLGRDRAIAIYREMQAAFDAVPRLVAAERIDCALAICGRLMVARSPAQYEALARELELRRKHLGNEFAMIPRASLHREIGSDRFAGGALIPDLGSLHPGLYHLGLLARAREAGAAIHARTPVTGLAPDGAGTVVRTARGSLTARDVLVATNGYTGALLPWLRRRVIPFNAFMIATAPLPPDLIARLLPEGRTYIDCNFNVNAFRRSPDGTRLLYCGRTGIPDAGDPHLFAAALKATIADIFPDLAGIGLSRAWTGRCAGTFDYYPHIGAHQGVHYAMGYCFAGVPMGTYLGGKAAAKIRGDAAAGATIFDGLGFPTKLFYSGNPWFVPLAMRYYDWQDRRAAA